MAIKIRGNIVLDYDGSSLHINNMAVGYKSLLEITSGEGNTGLGYLTLRDVTSGLYNTALGANAGSEISTGNYNTILGNYTGGLEPINSTGSNWIIIADGQGNIRQAIDSYGNVGIGTISPVNRLSVYGGNVNIGSTGFGLVFPDGTLQTTAFNEQDGVTSFSAGLTGLTPNVASTGHIVLGGVLNTSNGGTGLSSFISGTALYADSSSTLTTGILPISGGGSGTDIATGTGNLVLSESPTITSPTINDAIFKNTFTLGEQIFYEHGYNGFSVNEDFDITGGTSNFTGYHFTSGGGRDGVAFTLARTGQFTTGFGIDGTAYANEFVIGSEASNTTFVFKNSIGMPFDVSGGNTLASIDPNGNFTINGTNQSIDYLSGALIVGGGVGVDGAINASGQLYTSDALNVGSAAIVNSLTSNGSISGTTGAFTDSVGIGTSSTSYQKLAVWDGNIKVETLGFGYVFPDGTLQTTAFNNISGAVISFSAGSTGLTPSSPSTGQVVLGGVLNVSNGGTSGTTFTPNGVLFGDGTNPIQSTDEGGLNTVLVANAGTPYFSSTPTLNSVYAIDDFNTGGTATVNSLVSNGAISGTNATFTSLQSSGITTVDKLVSNTDITVSSGGINVTGYSQFTGNVSITGNLVIGSNNIIVSQANVLVIDNPIIYVGENNPADIWDLGIVSSYTESSYLHTGFLRNHSTNEWTLFDNLVTEPNKTINWAEVTYANMRLGNLYVSGDVLSQDSSTGALVITGTGGLGVGGAVNVSGQIATQNGLNVAQTAIINALVVNTAIYTDTVQAAGSAIVNTLTSNGAIIGTTVSGTDATFTSLQSSGSATVNSLVSNSSINGTTGLFTDSVGIGTSSTSYQKLVVWDGNIKVETVGFGYVFPDGTFQTTAAANTPPGGTDRAIQFNDAGVFGGDVNQFSFDINGNVGIGTSSPLAMLDVRGDALINGLTVGLGNGSVATNMAVGYQALYYNSTGSNNQADGYQALLNNTTGSNNQAVGFQALYSNTTGIQNQAIGIQSLYFNTTGFLNTAIGYHALYSNTTGWSNHANGYGALYSNTTGFINQANGSGALFSNTDGYKNQADGYKALYSNTSGVVNQADGYKALYSNTTGNQNQAFGYQALYSNTTGGDNHAFGYNALYSNVDGYANIAVGYFALYANTSGTFNHAIGYSALGANTIGNNNHADGYYALQANTTGSINQAVGNQALMFNTTGNYNQATGALALHSNTTGSSNKADGYAALYSNTTGDNNLATGIYALYSNTTGTYNVAYGKWALYANTTGYNNLALGTSALQGNTDGYNNQAVGYQALYSNTDGYNNQATGYQALYSNTTGSRNQATGYQALYSNTDGYKNQADGYQALYSNTSGHDNQATGTGALLNNTTGNFNQADGNNALSYNSTGSYNTAFGYLALLHNTTASYNLAIGYQALVLNTTGDNNHAVGYQSLISNTTGSNNQAFGSQALYSNIFGWRNHAFGYQALYNTTSNDNNAFGYQALYSNTDGYNNIAFGNYALYSNTTGISCIAVGHNALYSNTTGYDNHAFGYQALYNNTTGINNNAFGSQALHSNTTGDFNEAFGYNALSNNTTGTKNLAVGHSALYSNTIGNYNHAVGYGTLGSNTTGYNNHADGYLALYSNTTGNNNQACGYQALQYNTTGSNNLAEGYRALYNNTTGSSNTAFGSSALFANTIGNSNHAFGWSALEHNTEGNNNHADGVAALYTNTTGSNNQATGYFSLYYNDTGYNNQAVGYQALYSNTDGYNNQAVGYQALYYNTGSANHAVGYQALYSNTTGNNNQATGYWALYSNTTGSGNQADGIGALSSNTTGWDNLATGYNALQSNTTGFINSAFGYQALYSNTTGPYNTAIGYAAMHDNTVGGFNTAIGYYSLFNNDGYNNLAVGYQSGQNITTGSGNSIFGSYTGASGPINHTGNGYVVLSDGYGTVRLYSDPNGNIGIGTTGAAVPNKLSVFDGNIQAGTTGYGYVFPDGTFQTTAATNTPPGGTDRAIQFNDNGVFGGNVTQLSLGTDGTVNVGGNVQIVPNGYGFVFPDGTFQTTAFTSTSGLTSFRTTLSGLTPASTTSGDVVLSGLLNVANGGIGTSTLTSNGVLFGNGTSAVQTTDQGGTNSVLTANNGAPSFSSDPVLTTLTTTSGLNAGGAATVNSLESNGSISGTTIDGTVITGSTGFEGGYVSGTVFNARSSAIVNSLTSNGAISGTTITGTSVQSSGDLLAQQITSNSTITADTGLTVNSGGATVTGNSQFNNNVAIAGTLILQGNIITNTANILVVEDPIIYLGEDNPANLWDSGIVTSYTTDRYRHTGFVRDHNNGVWTIFDNLITEPGNTIVWDQPSLLFGNFKVGNINVAGSTSSISTSTGSIITVGGVGIGENLNVGSSIYSAGIINAGSAAIVNSLTSNTTISGTTITSSTGFEGGYVSGTVFNARSSAIVNTLISNGAIQGTTISGTTGTFTSLQSSGIATVNSLTSNTTVTATTGFQGGYINGTTINASGSAIVNSLTSNGVISGTTGTFTSLQSSGIATVNSLTSNTTIDGTIITASTGVQGGYLNGTTINASSSAIVNSLTSNGVISGTTISGTAGTFTSLQSSGVATVNSLTSNSTVDGTIITASTGFEGGYVSGTIFNARSSAIVNELTSNTTVTATTGFQGGYLNGTTINASSSAIVNSLTSNGVISGTTGTFTSLQSSGIATVNALVSNVYGQFGQNVTINSTNVSISKTTGALVVGGGLGVSGNVYVGNVNVGNHIDFTKIPYTNAPDYIEGRLWYSQDEDTLILYGNSANVQIPIGEREWVRCRNSSGAMIPKGTPVYEYGVHMPGHPVHGHHPLIAPADASDPVKKNVIGITGEDIQNLSHGYVVTRGYIEQLNTSNLVSGQKAYLGAETPGTIIPVSPDYPNYPFSLGFCLTSNATVGTFYVTMEDETFDKIRITGTGFADGDFVVNGNLTVNGKTTSLVVNTIDLTGSYVNLLSGDSVLGQFLGSGTNDGSFKGKYTGTVDRLYYVKIDSVGATDTFAWSYDNFATTEASGIAITGAPQYLSYGVSVQIQSNFGHNLGDYWLGTATPSNSDFGLIGNYVDDQFRYSGLFRDSSDGNFKFFKGYTGNITANINTLDSSFTLANLVVERSTSNYLNVLGADPSLGSTTGAVVINGGLGVGESINAVGQLATTGGLNVGGTAIVNNLISNTAINGTTGTFSILHATDTLSANVIVSNSTITASTGLTVLSGGMNVIGASSVTGNLSVSGNIFVSGTVYRTDSNVIVVDDPLLYLANKNPANLWDLGIIASYDIGVHRHTGFARNHNDGVWTVFDGISSEPYANQITWDQGNFGSFKAGNVNVAANINSFNTLTGALVVAGGVGIGSDVNIGGQIYTAGIINTGSTAIVNALTSNGAISGTTITGSTGFQGGYVSGTNFNASGTATVNSLVSNGAISGTTLAGTSATLTGLEVSGLSTVNSFVSNTSVQGNSFVLGNTVDYTLMYTSSTTSQQTIDTFATASYRAAEYQISISSGSTYEITKLTVIHDNTTGYLVEYDKLSTGTWLAAFEASVVAGNLELLATPANALTTFKIYRKTWNV